MQASGEIAINARTRAKLTSKPDKYVEHTCSFLSPRNMIMSVFCCVVCRPGFSSQRPTRPTCHFVIKAAQAGNVLQTIDNHLRTLAQQLSGLGSGAEDAEASAADSTATEPAAGAGIGALSCRWLL